MNFKKLLVLNDGTRRNWLPPTLALFSIILGTALFANHYSRILFYYADGYTKITLGAILFFSPLVFIKIRKLPLTVGRLGSFGSSPGFRKYFTLPLISVTVVASLFIAPLGWLYGAAVLLGDTVELRSATAVSVKPYTISKSCNQRATLRFENGDKDTCLDGLLPPEALSQGQKLEVTTISYPFGFRIMSITDAVQTILPSNVGHAAVEPAAEDERLQPKPGN